DYYISAQNYLRLCAVNGLIENSISLGLKADLHKKSPKKILGFLKTTYKEIELEVFCLLPSGSSMHPVPPINIKEIASRYNTFFMSSSSGL
ncbi:MAG: hypothetical protein DRQ62_10140, partial [Gammaproteobacteria bacterium]